MQADSGESRGGGAWEDLDLREAGRFVQTEARTAQELAWAKNEAELDARQIWGVREAQGLHRRELREAVASLFRVRALAAGLAQKPSALQRMLPPLVSRVMDFESGQGSLMDFVLGWQRAPPCPGSLSVCARKRPLLPWETKAGLWDAVEVLSRERAVVCHDGRLSRSGRRLSMCHRRFALHRAWGPASSTEDVYREAVAPLLEAALSSSTAVSSPAGSSGDIVGSNGDGPGCCATLLCMGQTGTGKTYTIKGIVQCLARDLQGQGDLEIEFFEICGRRCLDLLAGRQEVQLRADCEDRVRVCGQRAQRLPQGRGLEEVLYSALALRASEETERNANSSRSHAICTLRVLEGPGAMTLRLVDLAGSERNFETSQMTAQQHRESAEINASLMVLKDCFRAHAAHQRGERAMLPFRRSQLTRVLRDCFTNPAHRTVVIATVSPAATDVIHSMNTLTHATMLAKPLADLTSLVEVAIPLNLKGSGALATKSVYTWTPQEVLAWLAEVENGRFAHVVVPPQLNGRQLLETSPQGLSELFAGALRSARTAQEGEAWTVQVENVGLHLGRDIFAAARRAAMAQYQVAPVAGG
jgi:kinesin family protein 2/24